MESNSSIASRLLWLISGYSAAVSELVCRRSPQQFQNEIQSFRNHITNNFPDKLTEAEAVLTALSDLSTAIESLLDA